MWSLRIMFKRFPAVILLWALLLNYSSLLAQVNIMTYNIRYDNPGDNENWWGNRKSDLVNLINYYHPDIFGIQEGLYHQVIYLQNNLPNYTFIGVGRDDGKAKGEFSAIYYNKSKLELIDHNTFWLSETPESVSVGWDASMERICTYGIFKMKASNDTLYVFNTHFDHLGVHAREKSAELVINILSSIISEGAMVVLMGDFNSEPGSKPISVIKNVLDDGLEISMKKLYGPKGTYNNFKPDFVPIKRIDYIFTLNLGILNYRHIDDRRAENLWISDHLPVLLQAVYKRH